jgi:hypothetical protein
VVLDKVKESVRAGPGLVTGTHSAPVTTRSGPALYPARKRICPATPGNIKNNFISRCRGTGEGEYCACLSFSLPLQGQLNYKSSFYKSGSRATQGTAEMVLAILGMIYRGEVQEIASSLIVGFGAARYLKINIGTT